VANLPPRLCWDVYRWLDHTSEAELWIEDESPKAVLGEAAIALGDLLGEDSGGEPATHRVRVGSADLPSLLVEWLGELVYLAETDGFVPERIVEMDLAGSNVEAVVGGRRAAPQTLVKGVTYHGLEFEQGGDGGWHARVVLDV
jgi:SHS2 domain-containing protein